MRSIAALLLVALVSCSGGLKPHPEPSTRTVLRALVPTPSAPPGIISPKQQDALVKALKDHPDQESYILQFAEAAWYNCIFQTMWVDGKLAQLLVRCGGVHFNAGTEGRPK